LQKDCAIICNKPEEQGWREMVMMKYRIATNEELERQMIDFLQSNYIGGRTELKTVNEFKQHFANWLRKKQSSA